MKRLSDKIYNMLNEQIRNEHESSTLYLTMSQWLDYNGWSGGAKLWKKYSDEELSHRDKFYSYIQDRDCMPKTLATKEQPISFDCVKDIAEASYKHEIQVTEWIKQISLASIRLIISNAAVISPPLLLIHITILSTSKSLP